jgi:hypothetical protein
MSTHFFLSEKVKPNAVFAITEGETPLAYELIDKLRKKSELPFKLYLKTARKVKGRYMFEDYVSEDQFEWIDYHPNNLAWPLMSSRMKNIIENNLNGQEGVDWIRAILYGHLTTRDYFIPRFQTKLDVLDFEKTTYVKGTDHIIKPVFSLSKIANFSMFHLPEDFWQITSGLYINSKIKRELELSEITGIEFESVKIA